MAPAPTQKILRVGVIQGGKIIEERHLKKRENVTVGHDAKNTFVVPASNLPPSFPVFELKAGQYSLLFTEHMEGRVRVGSADVDFSGLRAQGLAKKRGDVYVLPLTDAAKGKVSLGEVTLLFQFVTPPPEPPKPELPAAVKGSFWQSMDQMFLLVLASSLFLHFSGVTFIICQPLPVEQELALDELPDRFAKVMMPMKIEPPKVEESAQGSTEDAKKDDSPKKASKTPAGGGDPAAKKAAMQKAVASKGLLKILGSAGAGGGAFEDVLGGGTGAGDIAAALAGAGGVGVATSDSIGAGGPKGGGTGTAASIGDLGTSGGGNVNLGTKGDVKVSGRVQDQAPEVDSADIDRDAMTRYVRSRMSAIKNCYERELKRNPSLKGKVVVRFSITPAGRSADIEIEENSLGNDAVANCIRTVIRGWVFPFKPPSEVPVAYPFVFAPAG
ncbi:MAG: AgmX/PglI C-terminal domain-containing protein [Myxococcota bacterium]